MMNLIQSINKINALITESQGNYIQFNDFEYRFVSEHIHSQHEIQAFENLYNIQLPHDYKTFLHQVGSCKLYFDRYEVGIEFYILNEIYEFTKTVFNNENMPFPQLLLIGSNLNNGDILGFNLNHQQDNFSIYSIAEEYPENWIDIDEFITLEKFLGQLVESDGEDYFLER